MADKDTNTSADRGSPPQQGESPTATALPPGAHERPESVVPPHWGPDMMLYGDISRMMFRLHRNLSAHVDAHKRLAERLQSVFAHEQAMVLELARLIDESMTLASRGSNADKPPLGKESIDRIFDHAASAMKETGRMLTEIQLESLDLLKQYITDAAVNAAGKGEPKGTDKA